MEIGSNGKGLTIWTGKRRETGEGCPKARKGRGPANISGRKNWHDSCKKKGRAGETGAGLQAVHLAIREPDRASDRRHEL